MSKSRVRNPSGQALGQSPRSVADESEKGGDGGGEERRGEERRGGEGRGGEGRGEERREEKRRGGGKNSYDC